MTQPKILPCPFCGEEPSVRIYKDESLFSHRLVDYMYISCMNCDISMNSENHDEVIAAWNRRTPVEL